MKNIIKILPLVIIIFFGFAQSANLVTGNWYQQFMPNLNGMPISDIFFLDSLTGWAVTNNNLGNDSGYILKTTNRGDSWNIKLHDRRDFGRVKFVNQNTGFVCGGTGSGTSYLFESTDSGENWFIINNTSFANFFNDMSVLNVDTIWLADPDGLLGGVFRTTNGGASWAQQLNLNVENPKKIYMYNRNIGFVSSPTGSQLYRTTNSGLNWAPVAGTDGFSDMKFMDTLTGWKCIGNMKKTTNGGLTWITQTLPQGGIISVSSAVKMSFIGTDTIWAVGSYVEYPNLQDRGILFRTTNGGINWLFQVPDTSIHDGSYAFIQFNKNKIGWAYTPGAGIHTTNGGDTTFILGIKQISSQIPKDFYLYQNYPNPFNPSTNIKYQITASPGPSEGGEHEVRLIVYDITGREIIKLVNQQQNAGTYEVDFSGSNLSSGVYFYQLTVSNEYFTEIYTETKKMILIK